MVDDRDPRAPALYIDIEAAIILVLTLIIVVILTRVNIAPALPNSQTSAPIYAPPAYTSNDHRVCVIVVDCSQ